MLLSGAGLLSCCSPAAQYLHPPALLPDTFVISFSPQPTHDKFQYKSQSLSYLKGQAQQEPAITFSYVKETLTPEEIAAMSTNNPSKVLTDAKTPQWIENSGKVLRFFGHFLESVVESPIENHRVRRVIILFYLEDGTIQMSEPKQDNSGIPQARTPAGGAPVQQSLLIQGTNRPARSPCCSRLGYFSHPCNVLCAPSAMPVVAGSSAPASRPWLSRRTIALLDASCLVP